MHNLIFALPMLSEILKFRDLRYEFNTHPLCADFPSVSSLPEWHQLDLIEGNGKTVRVIKQAAAKWESVATRLHFKIDDLSRIRKDHHQQSQNACQTVFMEWLQGRGRKPTTWDTVIKALEEADLSELAADLKIVFSAT